MSARILVIEDDPDSLELMTYLLTAHGYSVLAAKNGQEGVSLATQELPDLVVCDIQLPIMNGLEVAGALKFNPRLRHFRKIPLVAVTAFAMVGDRDKVLAGGFDGYLTKPITPETFVPQIESFLDAADRSSFRPAVDDSQEAPNLPLQERRVLVVDNYPANLELARSILEPNGFLVTTAKSLPEAIALARQIPFDLVLSDICMTNGSGYDLLKAFRADPKLCAIPIILITSTMMERKDRDHGLELGATRFLIRPLETEELLREVVSCVRKGSPTHA